MLKLSEARLNKLHALALDHLVNAEWPLVAQSQQERSITHRVVGPILTELINSIGEKQFVLRFDGGHNPRAILRHGMNFLPDAEINLYSQKCLAVEVKILRDSDASGSLTKAVGQTFMYRALGFEIAFGLIFDARAKPRRELQGTLDALSDSDPRVNSLVI